MYKNSVFCCNKKFHENFIPTIQPFAIIYMYILMNVYGIIVKGLKKHNIYVYKYMFYKIIDNFINRNI